MDGRDDSGFNPYLRHHVGAPEKHYARLRAGGSVQWSRAASTWVVTGYAEALAVLRSPDFVAPDLRAIVRKLAERAKRPLPHVDQFLLATLMFNETADHAVLRRLLARLIGSQPMAVVGSIAEAVAAELWQAARQRGRIDLAGEFAELLPSRVMGRIFGITENERLRFAEFTHGLMAVLNQGCALSIYETLNAQLAEGLEFVRNMLRSRHRAPQDDGLTRMLEVARELAIDEDALAASIIFLYLASVDTSAGFIGSAILTLLRTPSELERLRSGAVPLAGAVEELLRYETPAPEVMRVAVGPHELAGQTIVIGDPVVVLVGAANRDPASFADPDRLDLGRSGRPHLAFSEGGHSCLGSGFARLEARIAIQGFLMLPTPRVDPEPLSWWPHDAVRRLRRLDLVFT